MNNTLPEQFKHLEDLVPSWAVQTERERKHVRVSRDFKILKSFFERMGPEILPICQCLDKFPVAELSSEYRNLLYLAYMYMEVGIAVEFYQQPSLPDGFPTERFNIKDLPRAECGEISYK